MNCVIYRLLVSFFLLFLVVHVRPECSQYPFWYTAQDVFPLLRISFTSFSDSCSLEFLLRIWSVILSLFRVNINQSISLETFLSENFIGELVTAETRSDVSQTTL